MSRPSQHNRYQSEPRITGDQMTPAQVASIFTRLAYDPQTGCLNWTGGLTEKGYGQVVWKDRKYRAHILVWEWVNKKPVPQGKELDHECNNRRCCCHTQPVTHQENMALIRNRPAFDFRAARDFMLQLAHIESIQLSA